MKSILILAIGSPSADDQLAWLVVDDLQTRLKASDMTNKIKIDIEKTDRPGLNLLLWFEQGQYDLIILIDAVLNPGSKAGEIFSLSLDEIAEFRGFLSSHNIGVAPAIALAKTLDMLPKRCHFFGMQAQNVSIEQPVSTAVLKAIPQLVQRITQMFL